MILWRAHFVTIAVSSDTKENATITLEADLAVPNNVNTKGIVLFAHGYSKTTFSTL